jgi:hypothetical protein
MDTLNENRAGLGLRKLIDTTKDRGTPVGRISLEKHLPLLEQAGYIRIEKADRQGLPDKHVFLKAFKRSHLIDGMLPSRASTTSSTPKPATARTIDMSSSRKFGASRPRTRMNV